MKINHKLLKTTCHASIESFRSIATETVKTPDGVYHYIDNGSNILGIAHLDTVLGKKRFSIQTHKGVQYVYSAQLDDRLGVYVLLHILPELGINVDVLLTEGEEVGRSTGAHFTPSKEYKWMFQFDRRGGDVVMYDYESDELIERLQDAGFKIGHGSFSDIAFMEHLGIKGFNVGTGYEFEHTPRCRANLSTLARQIKKFQRFYHANKDTALPHIPVPVSHKYGYKYARYGDYRFETSPDACYLCNLPPRLKGDIFDMGFGIKICNDCLPYAAECSACADYVFDTEIIGGLCPNCQYYSSLDNV